MVADWLGLHLFLSLVVTAAERSSSFINGKKRPFPKAKPQSSKIHPIQTDCKYEKQMNSVFLVVKYMKYVRTDSCFSKTLHSDCPSSFLTFLALDGTQSGKHITIHYWLNHIIWLMMYMVLASCWLGGTHRLTSFPSFVIYVPSAFPFVQPSLVLSAVVSTASAINTSTSTSAALHKLLPATMHQIRFEVQT